MTDVVLSGVTKRFGAVTALDAVDLAVSDGTLTAILGPSGCGKTTLLRVIAGFERLDAGQVRLGDRQVAGDGAPFVPPEHRRVGLVPQEAALFPHLDVAGNVGFGIARRGRSAQGGRAARAGGAARVRTPTSLRALRRRAGAGGVGACAGAGP